MRGHSRWRQPPPGGPVRVPLATGAAEALVVVTDTGPGLGVTELPHRFDR